MRWPWLPHLGHWPNWNVDVKLPFQTCHGWKYFDGFLAKSLTSQSSKVKKAMSSHQFASPEISMSDSHICHAAQAMPLTFLLVKYRSTATGQFFTRSFRSCMCLFVRIKNDLKNSTQKWLVTNHRFFSTLDLNIFCEFRENRQCPSSILPPAVRTHFLGVSKGMVVNWEEGKNKK